MKYLKSYNILNENRRNIHERYPYNCIVIVINDNNELNKCLDIFRKMDILNINDAKGNITQDLLRSIKCYVRLFYGRDNQKLTISGNVLSKVKYYSDANKFKYQKEYTIDDVINGKIEKY